MRKGIYSSALVALIGAATVYGLFWFQYYSGNTSYNLYLVINMLALLWVPLLTILLLLRADLSSFGFTPGFVRGIWPAVGIMFLGLLALMGIVAPKPAFQDYYPIFRRWDEFQRVLGPYSYPQHNPFLSWPMAMFYAEVTYGAYLFCWEFFFRGYLLFGLQRSLGSIAAVMLQAAAFGLLHWGKPEMLPSFAAGIILGVLALRAKSFVPGFVLHWAASISFDVLVVAMRHS